MKHMHNFRNGYKNKLVLLSRSTLTAIEYISFSQITNDIYLTCCMWCPTLFEKAVDSTCARNNEIVWLAQYRLDQYARCLRLPARDLQGDKDRPSHLSLLGDLPLFYFLLCPSLELIVRLGTSPAGDRPGPAVYSALSLESYVERFFRLTDSVNLMELSTVHCPLAYIQLLFLLISRSWLSTQLWPNWSSILY